MKLQHLNAPKNLTWEVTAQSLEKWDRSILAADKETENTISIYDYIGADFFGEGVTVKRIAAALRSIGAENDVIVNINSPGGSMFEGLAIYNTLKQHKGNVTVRVVGLAASAASIIAMAGDKVEVAKAGFLMIHNAWTVVVGNRHDFEDAMQVMEAFDKALNSIYSDSTGIDEKKIAKMMDSETWIGGDEAVDLGFAHSLLPTDKVEKKEAKNLSPLNQVDIALAKAGMPRSQRRDLIKEITNGKSCAADSNKDITPGADAKPAEDETLLALAASISSLKEDIYA